MSRNYYAHAHNNNYTNVAVYCCSAVAVHCTVARGSCYMRATIPVWLDRLEISLDGFRILFSAKLFS